MGKQRWIVGACFFLTFFLFFTGVGNVWLIGYALEWNFLALLYLLVFVAMGNFAWEYV